jgi:tRNA G18 (ribose-2'-O)-methylase SpoU
MVMLMPVHRIEAIDDPRLDVYRDLRRARTDDCRTFVAEGEKLAVRLFASRCRTVSVLCTKEGCESLTDCIPVNAEIYVSTSAVISQLVGFKFHRGILAAGVPPAEQTLCEILGQDSLPTDNALVVVCPEIRDPGNLGAIIRSAAAFGACAVVVGCEGTAPYSRRVLRTSMGAVLEIPIVQTNDWRTVTCELNTHRFSSLAMVLDESAAPLSTIPRTARTAVWLGNEDAGLSDQVMALCEQRVKIPMANAGLSLNVAVAAGIALYHFAPSVG